MSGVLLGNAGQTQGDQPCQDSATKDRPSANGATGKARVRAPEISATSVQTRSSAPRGQRRLPSPASPAASTAPAMSSIRHIARASIRHHKSGGGTTATNADDPSDPPTTDQSTPPHVSRSALRGRAVVVGGSPVGGARHAGRRRYAPPRGAALRRREIGSQRRPERQGGGRDEGPGHQRAHARRAEGGTGGGRRHAERREARTRPGPADLARAPRGGRRLMHSPSDREVVFSLW